MNYGLLPNRHDHRDYDALKSLGATMPQSIPDFDVDAGIWTPDQRCTELPYVNGAHFMVPPLPYGCTSYTEALLCIDEDGVLYNPMDLEAVTHANEKGGIDLRTAMKAGKTVYKRDDFFAIQARGALDFFDAVRLSLFSTKDQKRSASIGTPWYREWLTTDASGILIKPVDYRAYDGGHNWKISGQKTINGVPYLIGKPLLGDSYGDRGRCYVSREIFNNIMSWGGGAYTYAKLPRGAQVQTVDTNIVQIIVSFIRNLFRV